MKVLSESWELSQEFGDCEPTKTTYWSAKEAYKAGDRTVVFNQTLPTYKELKEALAYSLHLHKELAPNE